MNTKGVDVEDELRMLTLAGYTSATDFTQHPYGDFGPDAIADGRFIEVRRKDCTKGRCRTGYNDAPAGVSINVCEIAWHKPYGPFLFLVEFRQMELFGASQRDGYKAMIDPATAAKYERGTGRDRQHTGKQEVYGIPLDEFEFVYSKDEKDLGRKP